MSRRGVVLVLFDLPVQEREERKAYALFRKNLKALGYRMVQESVYVKLLRNRAFSEQEMVRLQEITPQNNGSSLLALPLSLNQFRQLRALAGKGFDLSIFSDDIVFL